MGRAILTNDTLTTVTWSYNRYRKNRLNDNIPAIHGSWQLSWLTNSQVRNLTQDN
jgi:hypothetical protein